MPAVPASLLDGKEGVDGSSPSEGLQNPRSRGFSVQNDLLFVVRAVGMEPFMELSRTRLDLFRAKDEVGVAVGAMTASRRNRWVVGARVDQVAERVTTMGAWLNAPWTKQHS